MISVVVITYNQQESIKECLDSIIGQDISEPIEILVGDDASKDRTAEIIAEYALRYPDLIKPVFREKNIGATQNILDLLRRTTGEYIAFCEGDDYWIGTEKLSSQTALLKQSHELAGIVHDTILVDNDGRSLANQKLSWIECQNIYTLDRYNGMALPGHISSLLVKREVIADLDCYEELFCDRHASDRVLFLITLLKGHIAHINKVYSAYRYMRDARSNNVIAKIYQKEKTACIQDMKILNAMDEYLLIHYGKKHHVVMAQSRILITALFHQLKGYHTSFYEVWRLCSCRYSALLRLPIAFIRQLRQKYKIMLKIKNR